MFLSPVFLRGLQGVEMRRALGFPSRKKRAGDENPEKPGLRQKPRSATPLGQVSAGLARATAGNPGRAAFFSKPAFGRVEPCAVLRPLRGL